MYCIRLIRKSVSETDKNGKIIYDDFITATHLKITKGNLYFYDPVTSNSEQDYYDLNSYSYVFINHYLCYTIKELEEAYERIVRAYATLSQSSSYHRDFDNVISILELVDTMFSIKEKKIINEVAEKNKSKINSLLHNNKSKYKSDKENTKTKKSRKHKDEKEDNVEEPDTYAYEDDEYDNTEDVNDSESTNENETNGEQNDA